MKRYTMICAALALYLLMIVYVGTVAAQTPAQKLTVKQPAVHERIERKLDQVLDLLRASKPVEKPEVPKPAVEPPAPPKPAEPTKPSFCDGLDAFRRSLYGCPDPAAPPKPSDPPPPPPPGPVPQAGERLQHLGVIAGHEVRVGVTVPPGSRYVRVAWAQGASISHYGNASGTVRFRLFAPDGAAAAEWVAASSQVGQRVLTGLPPSGYTLGITADYTGGLILEWDAPG